MPWSSFSPCRMPKSEGKEGPFSGDTCEGFRTRQREVIGQGCDEYARSERRVCRMSPCSLERQAARGTKNDAVEYSEWTNHTRKPVFAVPEPAPETMDETWCMHGGRQVRNGWSGPGVGSTYRCETCRCIYGQMICVTKEHCTQSTLCSHTTCKMHWSVEKKKYEMLVFHPHDSAAERHGALYHCTQLNGNKETCSCYCHHRPTKAPTMEPTPEPTRAPTTIKQRAKLEAQRMIREMLMNPGSG